jgi:hypothetical protein
VRNEVAAFLAICLFLSLCIGACTTAKDDNNSNPVQNNPVLTLTVQLEPATIPADGASRAVVFVELMRGDAPAAD